VIDGEVRPRAQAIDLDEDLQPAILVLPHDRPLDGSPGWLAQVYPDRSGLRSIIRSAGPRWAAPSAGIGGSDARRDRGLGRRLSADAAGRLRTDHRASTIAPTARIVSRIRLADTLLSLCVLRVMLFRMTMFCASGLS
jgi:hypothetical protein